MSNKSLSGSKESSHTYEDSRVASGVDTEMPVPEIGTSLITNFRSG